MKINKNIVCIILITTILPIVVSSCDFSKVKFGEVRMMYGSNEDGRIAYDISIFTGIKRGSLDVEMGQDISITYKVVLDKGSLVIEWQDPSGEVVWQRELVGNEDADEIIPVDSPGKYVILVQGRGAGGNFDVSWQVD